MIEVENETGICFKNKGIISISREITIMAKNCRIRGLVLIALLLSEYEAKSFFNFLMRKTMVNIVKIKLIDFVFHRSKIQANRIRINPPLLSAESLKTCCQKFTNALFFKSHKKIGIIVKDKDVIKIARNLRHFFLFKIILEKQK